MVCKECGAYNADDLFTCRVCGAQLKEGTDSNQQDRPEKNFVQAPSFTKKAFHSEISDSLKNAQQAARARAEQRSKAENAVIPAAVSETVEETYAQPKRFCTSCGKPLFADAPFCAFCGAKNVLAAAAAEQTAEDVLLKKAVSVPEISVEDEDIEEEKPIKKTIFHKKSAEIEPDEDEIEDDFEDEEEDDFEEDEFDDQYYDDEFDDDEEDQPRKKGKGSTVLFIVLIVILLALIAFFAMFILKKKNIFPSILGGSDTSTVEPTPEPTPEFIEEDPITADNMTATIKEDVINGTEIFEINVKAPTGSVVRIISNANLEKDSVTIDRDNTITLHVPRVVFLPGDYCETASVTVTPQLEVTLPDGTTKKLSVPVVNIVVPQVDLELSSPSASPVEAPPNQRPITVSGKVTDHTCLVSVNGANVQVYEGGEFSYDYYPQNVEGETIEVVAKKIDCMTNKRKFEVTPFVIKDMTLSVANGEQFIRATDGGVTITGTCPEGAVITGSCEDPEIVCGDVIEQNGQFSCSVSVPKEGLFDLVFTASCEGYNDASASVKVESAPSLSADKYKKKALDLKSSSNYKKLTPDSDASAVYFYGKVTEIVQTEPYTVFKAESSGKTIYAANRSEKKKIDSGDIGKRMNIAGYYTGNYPDTEAPYIWAWYVWNG